MSAGEIYIPPEKRQINDDLKSFQHLIKIEIQKLKHLLDMTSEDKELSRFVTKKQIEVYDQPEKNYNVNKEIRIKTPMLTEDLCGFSDGFIAVNGDIAVTAPDDARRNEIVAFKNNAPFINSTLKIDCVQIDNAQVLGVVMPSCNLLECSRYYKKQQAVWNYYRDERSNPLSSNFESFNYKASITENTYNLVAGDADYHVDRVVKNETEGVIPLKCLSNFWKTLNISLINCEI